MHSKQFPYQRWARRINIVSKQTVDYIVNLKHSFRVTAVSYSLLYKSVVYNTCHFSNFFKQIIVWPTTTLYNTDIVNCQYQFYIM